MKIKLLLFMLLNMSVILYSQNSTGFGNVKSTTGIIIPNANIKIMAVADTNTIYQYICDKNGNYTFNFPTNGNDYIFRITPTNQSIQFNNFEANISLIEGDNSIIYHAVNLKNTNGIKFVVSDIDGNPVSNAKVLIYDTKRKWRIDSCSVVKAIYTDVNGVVEINSLLPIQYWFNVNNGYLNNRFTLYNTTTSIDTSSITTIDVQIRDLSDNEKLLSGLCDNKTWVTDSMIIFGNSQPYDADSKLLSDGTWWDSNGNHGLWWYNAAETELTYDYDSNSTNAAGSEVVATNLIITDTSFVGDMDMSGISITYYMSVVMDVIDLSFTVSDTTLYFDDSWSASINSDDVYMNSSYCFTCTTDISQTSFDIDDAGINYVTVTRTDRCGNTASETMTVNIVSTNSVEDVVSENIEIYPNPAKDLVTINSDNEIIEFVSIYNIKGEVVLHEELNKHQSLINISGLSAGVYILKIEISNFSYKKRLVVM